MPQFQMQFKIEHAKIQKTFDRAMAIMTSSSNVGQELSNDYDVFCREVANGVERDIVNEFCRFVISSFAMGNYAQSRELTEMHGWIVRGLTDEYTGAQSHQVHVARVFDFMRVPSIRTSRHFDVVLINWLGGLYYYIAEQTAMDDFGDTYLELAFEICNTPFSEYYGGLAFLLSRAMTWTVQTNRMYAPEFTSMNESLATNKYADKDCRKIASVSLSSRSGRLSKLGPKYWADYAFKHFPENLDHRTKLQLMPAVWDGASGKQARKILTVIRKNRAEIQADALTASHLRLLVDGRSELIKPILMMALSHSNMRFAHELLCIWYGVDKGASIPRESILWLIPSCEVGYMLIMGERPKVIERDSDDIVMRITDAANRFLSTSVSIRGLPSNRLHVPDRLGVPIEAAAHEFDDAMVLTYLPAEAIRYMQENCRADARQILLPSKPHPIQALQLKLLGTTWPLSASFRSPLDDSKILKVAIWNFSGMMAGGHELTLVEDIFSSSGAIVDVFGKETDTCSFIDVYSDPSYDIVWLISHGEYEYFSPISSHLEIGEDKSVDLRELLDCPLTRDERRLLVLNVCDGATHPGEGLLPHIGFAASLATPSQATISHKWPVASIPAAVFGSLLALELSRQHSFFSAYKSAVQHILSASDGGANIAEMLISATPHAVEFAERIRNYTQPFTSLANYGSAAFFE